MTPRGGIKPHNRFPIQANRAEVLFVDYITEHLTPNGKAGIVVPEGIIFKNDGAYKQLRRMLVEDGLWAVVSLPQGVFNPYSGVKTSVLFFNNTIARQAKEVLFVKVENDGFDLGAQRRPFDKNDLPTRLEVLKKYKKAVQENKKFSLSKDEGKFASVVKKEKIAENGNYNLSADHYLVETNYSNAQWPTVELSEVLDYEQPTKYIVNSVDYDDKYTTPVLTAGKTFILGYTNEREGIFKEKLPVIIFDDFTTATKLVNFPFKVKSSAMKILHAKEEMADIKFLYYLMQKIKFAGNEHKRYWISEYSKIKIPLPPIEVQEEIVVELENYQKIKDSAKQIVDNYKSTIKIDPSWKKVKLGDVCDTTSGGTPLKSKTEYYKNGDIPWLRSGEVAQGFITKSELFITKNGLKNSSAKLFPTNTVLVAMYGATAGQVGLLKFESSTNQAICGVLPNEKFIPEFLYQILKDKKDLMVRLSGGGAQPNISQTIIKNLEIPLPPIEVQKKIVVKVEEEQKLIEANKQIVSIFEQKIKEKISEVWGG